MHVGRGVDVRVAADSAHIDTSTLCPAAQKSVTTFLEERKGERPTNVI